MKNEAQVEVFLNSQSSWISFHWLLITFSCLWLLYSPDPIGTCFIWTSTFSLLSFAPSLIFKGWDDIALTVDVVLNSSFDSCLDSASDIGLVILSPLPPETPPLLLLFLTTRNEWDFSSVLIRNRPSFEICWVLLTWLSGVKFLSSTSAKAEALLLLDRLWFIENLALFLLRRFNNSWVFCITIWLPFSDFAPRII